MAGPFADLSIRSASREGSELSNTNFDNMGAEPGRPAEESEDGLPVPSVTSQAEFKNNKKETPQLSIELTTMAASKQQRSGPESTLDNAICEVATSDPTSDQIDMKVHPIHDNIGSPTLPIRQSLGLIGCFIIFGGLFLLPLVVGFLLFLWGGEGSVAGGAQAAVLWRKIMLNDWATRSVTLSTMVLRVTMAAQAAICTSMIAALLVERQQWPIFTNAILSVFRGVNVSPLGLLQKTLSLKARDIANPLSLYSVLLIILAVASLAVGLFSTILISDFKTAILIQFPMQTSHNVALSESTLRSASVSSYLSFENLHGWPTFGEAEAKDLGKPDADGISDTMLKERAFLPYDEDQRKALRYFKGPTTIMDTRISCVPPKIDASFNPIYPDGTYPYGSMNGSISYEDTFKNLNLSTKLCSYDPLHNKTVCLPPDFTCTVSNGLASSDPESSTSWVSSLCHLIIPEIESVTPAKPVTKPTNIEDLLGASTVRWNRDSEPWDAASYWHFLVITTNSKIDLLQAMNESDVRMLPLQHNQRYGEWSSFKLDGSSLVNITLCSAGFNMSLAEVELSSGVDPKEPVVRLNPTTQSLDAEDVQSALGASGVYRNPEERGILSMGKIQYLDSNSSTPGLDPYEPGMGTGSFGSFLFYNSLIFWKRLGTMVWTWNGVNTVSMCNTCWAWGTPMSRDVGVLFTRIINTGGGAALAIDALLFSVMSNWYYDLLPGFNVPGTVEASFSKECNIPRRWDGIVIVITTVTIHLICVLSTTILYVKRTKYTRQGNIWHTISQLVSATTNPTLELSGEKRDKDVSKQLQEDDRLVTICRSESGQVEVLPSGIRNDKRD